MTEVLMWHSKKPRRSQLRGFSIPFWVGGLIPRLATSYSSPSNRLCADKVVCKRVYEVERILLN